MNPPVGSTPGFPGPGGGGRDPENRGPADRPAPGVDAWLASGVRPARITGTLTADLPASFRSRPAAILAWRLAELRHGHPQSDAVEAG